jgi:hypothetical protein
VTARRDGLIVCCAISAGVHAALVPEHMRESVVTGAGFVSATVMLVALTIGLTARPESRAVKSFATLVLLGLLVSYAVASTIGIPVLHPDVDPIDTVGVLTKAVELTGLALASGLRGPVRGRPMPVGLAGLIGVFSALVALALAGHHQMSGM